MTLLAMPFVLAPDEGCLIVTAGGKRHRIKCSADPVSQRAVIDDQPEVVEDAPGTSVRVQWPEQRNDDAEVVWPFCEDDDYDAMKPQVPLDWCDEHPISERFLSLATGYAILNPHLTLAIDWFGQEIRFDATDTAWKKWTPNKPTSPHWYQQRHLERLVAAYISHDRDNDADRTVAEFVAEFDGLTGSKKRKLVLEETDLLRVKLSELATEQGLRSDVITKLLDAMKQHTKPVNCRRLGLIGKTHLETRFAELGCVEESFQYTKVARVDDGVPFVLETAFGWRGDDANDQREIIAGANWSPGISNPFRSFGSTGEGLESVLTDFRAGADEPIIQLIHLAQPRVEYTDRGKSALIIGAGDNHKEVA